MNFSKISLSNVFKILLKKIVTPKKRTAYFNLSLAWLHLTKTSQNFFKCVC